MTQEAQNILFYYCTQAQQYANEAERKALSKIDNNFGVRLSFHDLRVALEDLRQNILNLTEQEEMASYFPLMMRLNSGVNTSVRTELTPAN